MVVSASSNAFNRHKGIIYNTISSVEVCLDLRNHLLFLGGCLVLYLANTIDDFLDRRFSIFFLPCADFFVPFLVVESTSMAIRSQ